MSLLLLFGPQPAFPIANNVGTSVDFLGNDSWRITKVSGGVGYNADAVGTVALTGDFTLRISPAVVYNGNGWLAGFNSDPLTDSSYTSLDYALLSDNVNWYVFESGAQLDTIAQNTFGWIWRSGTSLYYSSGATFAAASASPVRTVTGVSGTFYFDSSLSSDGTVVDVMLTATPLVSNADLLSASQLSSPTITAHAAVTPANLVSVSLLGVPSITAHAIVTPASLVSASLLGSPTLTAHAVVTPASLVSASLLGVPALVAHAAVTPANLVSASLLSSPAIVAHAVLTPASLVSASLLSSPSVSWKTAIAPNGLVSASLLDSSSVSWKVAITPDDLTSASSLSSPSIVNGAQISPLSLSSLSLLSSPSIALGFTYTDSSFKEVDQTWLQDAMQPVFSPEFLAMAQVTVADRAALALLTSTTVAVLSEPGREGVFVYKAGDFTALAANDPEEGVVVLAIGGAFLRAYSGAVDVRWFGALADGAANDTVAIQAAINFQSAMGGGMVLLPAGSTKTGTLNRPENVTIQGQGKYASRLLATTGLNAPVIQSLGTLAAPINRGGVAGLTIIGSGKANTGCSGIKNVYTNRAVLRDVDIHACYRGVWSENVWQDRHDNVHAHGGGSDQNYMGFYMAPKAAVVGVSNAVIANGCVAQGCEKWGWRIENGNGSKFTSCEGMDGESAWYIGDPSSGSEDVQFMLFDSCLGDTCSSYTWRIEKGAAVSMKKMQFSNCWAGSSGASNVRVAGGSELTFSNWQLASSVNHGFHFQSCSRCSVSGSNIRDYNNGAAANHGVLLQDSLVIVLTGNQVYTSFPGTGKAVAETGSADNNVIVGNALAWGKTIIGAGTVDADNVAI